MTRYSDHYVATIDPRSVSDYDILRGIKESVKVMNKLRKPNEKAVRVVCRGRRPLVKIDGKSYTWGGGVVGGLANASMIDVYIYNR